MTHQAATTPDHPALVVTVIVIMTAVGATAVKDVNVAMTAMKSRHIALVDFGHTVVCIWKGTESTVLQVSDCFTAHDLQKINQAVSLPRTVRCEAQLLLVKKKKKN